RGGVTDEQEAPAGVRTPNVVEERRNASHRPAVALASGEREVDPAASLGGDRLRRRAVQLAVVDLAEAPVEEHGDVRRSERDLGGLDGSGQVGGEDGVDPVVAPALAQLLGER